MRGKKVYYLSLTAIFLILLIFSYIYVCIIRHYDSRLMKLSFFIKNKSFVTITHDMSRDEPSFFISQYSQYGNILHCQSIDALYICQWGNFHRFTNIVDTLPKVITKYENCVLTCFNLCDFSERNIIIGAGNDHCSSLYINKNCVIIYGKYNNYPFDIAKIIYIDGNATVADTIDINDMFSGYALTSVNRLNNHHILLTFVATSTVSQERYKLPYNTISRIVIFNVENKTVYYDNTCNSCTQLLMSGPDYVVIKNDNDSKDNVNSFLRIIDLSVHKDNILGFVPPFLENRTSSFYLGQNLFLYTVDSAQINHDPLCNYLYVYLWNCVTNKYCIVDKYQLHLTDEMTKNFFRYSPNYYTSQQITDCTICEEANKNILQIIKGNGSRYDYIIENFMWLNASNVNMSNDFSGVDQTPENQESEEGKTQNPEERACL